MDLLYDPGDPELSAPAGKWGQVILFGRDFDTMFKIAGTFGEFLLIFANDLELGNWALRKFGEMEDLISGVESELVFRDNKTQREMLYLDMLRTLATEKSLNSTSEEEKVQAAFV